MKFFKKLLIYCVGNGLSKLIVVLMLPIYTNYFNPNEYGQVDLVYNTVIIVVSFVFMELWTALLRFIYDKNKEENTKKVFTNVFFTATMLLIPFIIIQCVLTLFICKVYVIWSCIYGISYMYLQILQMFARGKNKNNVFAISGIINSIVQLIVAFIGTKVFKAGSNLVLIGPALGCLIAIIYISIICKPHKSLSKEYLDKHLIKQICKFSIPLSFNSIAFWAMNNINKYFAVYFLSYDASGYISIASKLTMVVTLASSIFSLAWQESAFENANNNERAKYYEKMFGIYVLIFGTATAAFMVIVKVLFPYLIGSEFNDALKILPTYFIAIFFSGISAFMGNLFSAEKQTGSLLKSTIVGTLVNIVTVVILIKRFEIMIIPIGSALGYFACVVMRYINIRKIVYFNIRIKEIAFSLIMIMLGCFMFYICDKIYLSIIFLVIIVAIAIVMYKSTILDMIKMLLNRKDKKNV